MIPQRATETANRHRPEPANVTLRAKNPVELVLVQEAAGGYSAFVPTLAGVISEGDTREEAWSNIEEALAAVLELYKEDNVAPPWRDPEPVPKDGLSKWVLVDDEAT